MMSKFPTDARRLALMLWGSRRASACAAVEAALKHALLHHKESTQKQAQLLNTSFNTFRLQMEGLGSDRKRILLEQFRGSCRKPEFPETLMNLAEGIAPSFAFMVWFTATRIAIESV